MLQQGSISVSNKSQVISANLIKLCFTQICMCYTHFVDVLFMTQKSQLMAVQLRGTRLFILSVNHSLVSALLF